MTMQTILVRKAEIMAADMDGSTVMMDIQTGKYYSLGEVGGVIWEILEQPTAVDSLIEQLMNKYDVSREQCEAETLRFLEQLMGSGLVLEAQE